MTPAPARAPTIRGASIVRRWNPLAFMRSLGGIVSARREKRIIMSSGRRNPPSPAMTNACHGSSHPASPRPAAVAATPAYMPRRERIMVRRLTRSATTPSPGASRVPPYCSAAATERRNGDPVWTSTYQPRIRFSISKPEEAVTSDPHWKRKLLTAKGARSPRLGLAPGFDPGSRSGSGLGPPSGRSSTPVPVSKAAPAG